MQASFNLTGAQASELQSLKDKADARKQSDGAVCHVNVNTTVNFGRVSLMFYLSDWFDVDCSIYSA